MATPMFEQYQKMKQENPDTLILFRLGDFYEGFDQDAITLSRVLGITLTSRGESNNKTPMAGIPFHALNQYLPKLIKAGIKVAIAEQTGEVIQGQLVKREITKIITSGTIIDENILNDSENNYLLSVFPVEKGKYQIWGFSFADISTGEFKVGEFRLINNTGKSIPKELIIETLRLNPAEIIVQKSISGEFKTILPNYRYQIIDDIEYYPSELEKVLLKHFNIENFKGFGLEEISAGIGAAGKLFQYILSNRKEDIPQINKLSLYNTNEFMLLDDATISNLELINPIRESNSNRTLFAVLNKCRTPMGQRKLRQYLLRPLTNLTSINQRLNSVNEFYLNQELLQSVIGSLEQITDLERVLAKISSKSGNARDLIFLKNGLTQSCKIIEGIFNSKNTSHLKSYIVDFSKVEKIRENVISLIEKSIKENPNITITEGDIIKEGYNNELDGLHSDSKIGKDFIQNLEETEIKRSGISSLKVRFNKVFGYYIEITNSNLSKVPSDYIRKQTLVNGERFITPELKEWEEKILGAEEKINFLEYQIFEQIRIQILAFINDAQEIVRTISEIDVLANFAKLALMNNYVMPELSDNVEDSTIVENGRHPVVENYLLENFVSNNIEFNTRDKQMIILTGPNMAGKSTYIRQVALIFLMAQIGCFVPASKAKIVITDRIFTRVGASDNLAGGESTFMVEMNETANILNNATEKSLIILDEVGRGTSTYDGLSIAWAIVDNITNKIGARTLFATHYHELLQLETSYPSIKNYSIQVIEKDNKIYFMHKIVEGGTDKSYGIHVAQLAGIPKETIDKANEILSKLELDENVKYNKNKSKAVNQIPLVLKESKNKIIEDISSLNLDSITPIDALNILKDLQNKTSKKNDN
jgi:DNA mismatch repair protein MutS